MADNDGTTMTEQTNHLYYGDNLDILGQYIDDEVADLIYLDPPFSSDRNYNVIFQEQDGDRDPAQVQAFEDTWRWD
jgi:16S rRNA G966 N2-methylase RsmD